MADERTNRGEPDRSNVSGATQMKHWPMRTIAIIAATLAGCTVAGASAAAADPRPGTSVAFFANNDSEFREAAERAHEWCAETYSAPAQYFDARTDSAGKVVRFACVLDESASHDNPVLASAVNAAPTRSTTH